MTCYYCGKIGHTKYKCDKFKADQKTNETHKASFENEQHQNSEVLEIHNFKIELEEMSINHVAEMSSISNTNDTVVQSSVKAITTDKANKNIMAGVILNDNIKCELEIDTGACNSIMSYDLYKEIINKSSDHYPELEVGKVIMKMADGSYSMAVKGLSQMKIARADLPDKVGVFKVIVVQGPHNLLGRSALKELWPEQYNSFVDGAKKSLDALCISNVCSLCTTNVPSDTLSSSQVHGPTGGITTTTTVVVAATEHAPCDPATTTTTTTDTTTPSTTDIKHNDTTTFRSDTHKPVIPPPPIGEITQEIGENYCLQICDEAFSELFDGELGDFDQVEAQFEILPGHEQSLKVFPCAKIPYGIEKEVYKELHKLAETCIPVDGRGLKVATQIIPVVKKKGNEIKVRLVGNYKQSINSHIADEHYQFTSINDQLDKLRGEYYTCLDFTGAYKQVKVGEESGKILVLTTPIGFLQPTRMPQGVKTAPKIFQKGADGVIQGMNGKGPIPSTVCVVDDICTTASTPQQHFDNLVELLTRLKAAGLKLNKEKCKFYQKEVKFLGKIIDKNGQRMDPATVEAIVNMPAPTNKHTLRSFLGHMSYIGKHLADIRTARAPLDKFLKKDAKFVWNDTHTIAFKMCKSLASNSATLAHF